MSPVGRKLESDSRSCLNSGALPRSRLSGILWCTILEAGDMSRLCVAIALLFPTVALGCPKTLVPDSQVEVPGIASGHGQVWYGSESLAVSLSGDGTFSTKHKLLWWREGAWDHDELYVRAKRVSGKPITANSWWSTNMSTNRWSVMHNPIGFPTPGCWQVTGTYEDASITFVTNVNEKTTFTYGSAGIYVSDVHNSEQLHQRLAANLKLPRIQRFFEQREYEYTWDAFKEAIKSPSTPLPEKIPVVGFEMLKQRLPSDARLLRDLLSEVENSRDVTVTY